MKVPEKKLIGIHWFTLHSVVIQPRAEALRKQLEGTGWVVWLIPLEETMYDKVAVYKRRPLTKAKWRRKKKVREMRARR